MPLIRISHPADAFTDEAKATVAAGLTDVLLAIEGGSGSPGARTLACVLFSPVAAGDWYVGGAAGPVHQRGPERIIVEVAVPEGATNRAGKELAHRQVHAVLADALGRPDGAGNINARVIVQEVPEGSWGAAGTTFGLQRIARYAGDGAAPDPDRMAFVAGYFAANARAHAAAGYPRDSSGLMVEAPTA